MFAVPGWAVSAKALAAAVSKSIDSANNESRTGSLSSRPSPKKRKRDEPGSSSESRITSEDLHRLWSKEFEGAGNAKQKHSKTKKKRQEPHFSSQNGDAEQEVSGVICNNAHDREKLDIREIQDTDAGRAQRKKHKKAREISALSKHVAGSAPNLEIKKRENVPPISRHGKRQENAVLAMKKSNVQRALEELQKSSPPALTTLTPMQAKMRDKLTSARFRHLNETLYTSPSSASFELFSNSPGLFAEYHAGFAQQVKDFWPENPVDGYIRDINTRAQVGIKPSKEDSISESLALPRRKTGSCTIADLGCGDAPLARAFQSRLKPFNLKFHSFDLHVPNSLVTKADIASLPLRDGEADVAIFCLSLMGTNWLSFIEEAWRVLRGDGKGELWVAEVKSRFGRVTRKIADKSAGKNSNPQKRRPKQEERVNVVDDDPQVFAEDETITAQEGTDISAFETVLQRRGFALQPASVNKSNKMFVSMIFNKNGVPSAGKHQGSKWNGREYERTGAGGGLSSGRKKFVDKIDKFFLSPEEEAEALKPCVYKKR